MNYEEVNGGALAYLGDAIWSLMVREELIKRGINNTDTLQKKSIDFVSGKAQAMIFNKLNEENFFSEDEIRVFKKGRNYKSYSCPKNTDKSIHNISTGFEALIAYLYLEKKETRLKQLWVKVKTLLEE